MSDPSSFRLHPSSVPFSPGLVDWLARGERGTSSETMVEALEGLPPGMLVGRFGRAAPVDPDDLRRCLLLLRAVPSYRERLGELAALSPVWAALVGAWDELEALFLSEMSTLYEPRATGKAPTTFLRMRSLTADHQRPPGTISLEEALARYDAVMALKGPEHDEGWRELTRECSRAGFGVHLVDYERKRRRGEWPIGQQTPAPRAPPSRPERH